MIAGVPDHVQADPQVDALLLAHDTDVPQPQLHLRQHGDLLMLRFCRAVLAGVIPVDPQHRQPSTLLDQRDQLRDQARVVDFDAAP